jgi:flavin reductase (DIM6/NTAB) family NADH-FMN oxidoreductase RutF
VNVAAISSLLALPDPVLWVVTAQSGERRGGLIATAVFSLSIVPELPRMLVALARQHHTWELVEGSNALALHLIDEAHIDWVWRFGVQSGRDSHKLAGLAVRTAASGSPILQEALGWLDCRIEARLEAGDRTVYVAEVLDGDLRTATPLTMKRMLELAPAEKKQALKNGLVQDSAVDAVAIRAWRQSHGRGNQT